MSDPITTPSQRPVGTPCQACGVRFRLHAHGLCGRCYDRARHVRRRRAAGMAPRPPHVRPCARCQVTGPIEARQLCRSCYRWLQTHDPAAWQQYPRCGVRTTRPRSVPPIIVCRNCDTVAPDHGRGLCGPCYVYAWRHGQPRPAYLCRPLRCRDCQQVRWCGARGLCQRCVARANVYAWRRRQKESQQCA